MLGEIVEFRNDVLMCRGEYPDNIIIHPVISNCYVIRENSNLFIIDTAAGPVMRKTLKQAVERLRAGTENLILLNTHIHVDHIANNDIINEFEGFKSVQHLVHEAGKMSFNVSDSLLENFRRIDRYYDIFEGPPPPWRTLLRFMNLGNREKALRQLVAWGTRKFEPVHPSPETVAYLEDKNAEEIELGTVTASSVTTDHAVTIDLEPLKVKGWRVGGAVIINDGAHSPEHILVYFPGKKLLITGDLTLELFPTWPGESSGQKNVEALHLCLEMAEENIVSLIMDSHHSKPPQNRMESIAFLKNLIRIYRELKELLFSQMRTGEKYTIKELYRSLRKMRFDNELINSLLENQFPRTPVFLKTVIAGMLVEEGCIVEGTGKSATFMLPG